MAEVTALKQRHATTGNPSVGGQQVGLTEYRCDVHSYIQVYGLKAELQFWESLKCVNKEMRKAGQGGKYQNINHNKKVPVTLE